MIKNPFSKEEGFFILVQDYLLKLVLCIARFCLFCIFVEINL